MKKTRQKGALERLENQLLTNRKPLKVGGKTSTNAEYVPLTDSDKTRISKEISILKSKNL